MANQIATEIGKIPDYWKVSKLGDVADVLTGFPFKGNEYSMSEGITVVRGENLSERSFRWDTHKYWKGLTNRIRMYLLEDNVVVLSMDGNVGKNKAVVHAKDLPMLLAQRVARVKAKFGTSQTYINQVILSNVFLRYCNSIKTGTAIAHISREQIEQFKIPLPPLEEQKAIGKILSDLDLKIELNQHMNKTLESIAQATFKSWFVDFDPVRAKMAGEPSESICKRLKLTPDILDLFPDRLVDSELGKIPEGWELKKLSDFIDLERGLSYKGKYLSDTGTPMVNLGCISKDSTFIETSIKYYTGDFKIKHQVSSGDIVIANTDITQKREVLGSPVFVPEIFENHVFIFTHHLYAVRFKNEISKHYIFQLLCTKRYRNRVIGFATGTTVLAIPEETILSFKFAEPTFKILSLFHILIDSIYERIKVSEKENNFLEETRDLLLPQLMSGKIRVPVGDANE